MKTTLYQKIFNNHLIQDLPNDLPLLYIDAHLIHEVTSPQAFDGLRSQHRLVRRPKKTFATMDHNVPTNSRNIETAGTMAKIQMQTLTKNCQDYQIPLLDLQHPDQGIIHVIGPELGWTWPGMTIVCGDSHTSTHGAFGALAFGIGTSEVEHVFATQTLPQNRLKNMKICLLGHSLPEVFPKDIILYLIGKIGTGGGTGHVVEFTGSVIQHMSMEGRMTLCNMAIEMGAKSGLIEPDHTTYQYLQEKKCIPEHHSWKQYAQHWSLLRSDDQAYFERSYIVDVSHIKPQITWGTNPSQVIAIDETIPLLSHFVNKKEKEDAKKSLDYMGLRAGTSLIDLPVDKVFIGSCTNARIEDLRVVAQVVQNRTIADRVDAWIVPGSGRVKRQAEQEGLDQIFRRAGFQWKHPGCSMCLGMNEDLLKPYERCASTSNRNFEGRQGKLGRTHLVSPWMAAQTALYGKFVHVESCSKY